MRALVQVMLAEPAEATHEVETWLRRSRFHPEEFGIPDGIRTHVLESERPDFRTLTEQLSVPSKHALDILSSIPLADEERRFALDTARHVIHFNDQHGNIVWGLVCIDLPAVTVRLRHKVSRSLEHVTQELVSKMWGHSGPGKLFEPFGTKHIVPVREPLSTSDAYHGEILPPGPLLKQLVRSNRRVERVVAWTMLGVWAVCSVLGYLLFALSGPDESLRWLSGFFDRLSTTALATAAVSYLTYFLHLRAMQRKPIIDWQ